MPNDNAVLWQVPPFNKHCTILPCMDEVCFSKVSSRKSEINPVADQFLHAVVKATALGEGTEIKL